MTATPGAASSVRPHGPMRARLFGRILLALAAVAFVVPWPHQVLTGLGSTDGRTLDSVSYERSLMVPSKTAPHPKQGDDLLQAVSQSQQAASHNKVAADRRLLCLALGLPGAYLLGRSRRRAGDQ